MPAPIITNPYNKDNPLLAYLNEPFSVKISVANAGANVEIYARDDWVGFSYRWLASKQKVELLVTPRRTLKDEVGILLGARNPDGVAETRIPYAFIPRVPVISDIPDQKWVRGQNVDFVITIQHPVNILSVRGDHIGLEFENAGEGVRIFGDLVDGDLLKDRGTFTVSTANSTGIAAPKTGNWRMYPQPSAVRNLTATFTRTGIVKLDWDAPTENGGYAITGYQYRLGDDGEWTDTGSADTDVTLTTVFQAGTYTFYARPVNSEGIAGAVADGETVRLLAPPQSVSGSLVRASLFVSATGVSISWKPPTDSTGVTGYKVRRAFSSTSFSAWVDVPGGASARSYTWTSGITDGLTLSFQVAAASANGIGLPSAIGRVYVQPPKPIPRPTWWVGGTVTSHEGAGDTGYGTSTRSYYWNDISRYARNWSTMKVKSVTGSDLADDRLTVSARLDSNYRLTITITFTPYHYGGANEFIDWDHIQTEAIVIITNSSGSSSQSFFWYPTT